LIAEQRAEVARKIDELRAFDSMLAALERTRSSTGSQECAILARVEPHDRSVRKRTAAKTNFHKS
jgi:hypothetical protein